MSALNFFYKVLLGALTAFGFATSVGAQMYTPRLEVVPHGVMLPFGGNITLNAGGAFVNVACYGYDIRTVCYVTQEMAWVLQSRGVYVIVPPPPVYMPPPPVYYPPVYAPPGVYIPFPNGGGVVIPLPPLHRHHHHHGGHR